MTVRFHESLPALIRAADKEGIPLDPQTVVVRDGAGRLILARERVPDKALLETTLRTELEGYAGSIVLVTGSAVRRLINDPTVSVAEVEDTSGQTRTISYADRRIVGMDWMHAPSPPANNPKRLVFGSLKGGVGRSTALAVLAADLARAGKRVLAIDLDIEAPGIGFMLLPASNEYERDRRPRYGVVDYLLENNLGGISDEDLYDFVGVSPFAEGSIDVIPAVGRETDEHPDTMISKLSRAMVEDRDEDTVVPVSEQVRRMVERFVLRGQYDAVLIDARAGMAEITAAPLLALGAHLMLFGTDQSQTFRGYAYILAHLVSVSDFANMNPDTDWRQRLSFVQAKSSSAPSKRAPFRNALYELCAEQLYDEEKLDSSGKVMGGEFAPGPAETGNGIPHDSLYIQFHPDYEAFDPGVDRTQLDQDVYRGPFGSFLERAWQLLALTREGKT